MKNPDWIREELILALDLYFRLDYGKMHGTNSEVIELSMLLKKLNLFDNISDLNSFRSVNSVSLKLANFKKLDQNFIGKGMRAGAKNDLEVWKEFHAHRDTLKNKADEIKKSVLIKGEGSVPSFLSIQKSDATFLFRLHLNKEKDPLILYNKLRSNDPDSKSCEICQFNFVQSYGQLGKDLLEIHFSKEITEEFMARPSQLEDFIIVCSNCHRMLDKHFGMLDAQDLKNILSNK